MPINCPTAEMFTAEGGQYVYTGGWYKLKPTGAMAKPWCLPYPRKRLSLCVCKLKPVETRVDRALFQLLKLRCDELLSNVAFRFKLRHYNTVRIAATLDEYNQRLKSAPCKYADVGWCKFKPVETRIERACCSA